MNSAKGSYQLALLGARQVSASQIRSSSCYPTPTPKPVIPKGYCRIKEKQARFQVDDGLPVFLKGGVRDRFLYKTTMFLACAGLAWSLKFILVDCIMPKSDS